MRIAFSKKKIYDELSGQVAACKFQCVPNSKRNEINWLVRVLVA